MKAAIKSRFHKWRKSADEGFEAKAPVAASSESAINTVGASKGQAKSKDEQKTLATAAISTGSGDTVEACIDVGDGAVDKEDQKTALSRSEGLWKQAFQELSPEERCRLEQFVPTDEHPATSAVRKASDELKTWFERRDASNSSKVWRALQKTADVILKCSNAMATVAAAEPHAAIAWTAISTILPLFQVGSLHDEKIAEGMQKIAFFLGSMQSKVLANLDADIIADAIGSLDRVEKALYIQILQFEAALVAFQQGTGLQRWIDPLASMGKWSERASNLESAWSQYAEVWQSTIKVEEHNHLRRQWKMELDRIADEKVNKLLSDLDVNYLSIKERRPLSEERIRGTGEWFFSHTTYNNWYHNPCSDLLWVTAAPGCGKSMLCKYLIDARKDLLYPKFGPTPFFCFYIFKDGDHNDAVSCMRAILHQLLLQHEGLACHFTILAKRNIETLDFGTLWDIFLDIVSNIECITRGVICVIDGLDECLDGPRRDLIEKMDGFFESQKSQKAKPESFIKLIATSRPYQSIEEHFRRLQSRLESIRLDLTDDDPIISADVNLYISKTVERRSKSAHMPEKWREDITRAFTDQQNRTYLFVSIVLDEYWSIQWEPESLHNFWPKNVEDAYEKMLDRSKHKEDARALLSIVLAAEEPLTTSEALIALRAFQRKEKSSVLFRDRIQQTEESRAKYIKDVCGLLLSIMDGKIYFIHQTARDFLLAKGPCNGDQIGTSSSEFWCSSFTLEECHGVLARACVGYFCLQDFALLEDLTRAGVEDNETASRRLIRAVLGDFAGYTSRNWSEHVRLGPSPLDDNLVQLIVSNMLTAQGPERYLLSWYKQSWYFRMGKGVKIKADEDTPTPLQLACAFGLNSVIDALVKQGHQLDKSTSRGHGLIYLAAEGGHDSTVEKLLGMGVQAKLDTVVAGAGDSSTDYPDPSSFQRENYWALECAVYQKDVTLTRLLLKQGLDQIQLEYAMRAACEGARWHVHVPGESKEIVRVLLIEQPSLASQAFDSYGTVAHFAASCGDVALLEQAINAGVDLGVEDGEGKTALLRAAEAGHVEVVRRLVEMGENHDGKGASVHHADSDGQMALLLAARGGHVEVVRRLLEHDGRLADAKTKGGQGLLHYAAKARAYDGVMALQVVLDYRGLELDVNATDESGRTPLMLANRPETLELLLKRGARCDLRDEDGNSTLMCFFARRYSFNDDVIRAIDILLAAGCRLEDVNKEGQNGIRQAVRTSPELLRFVLSKSASPHLISQPDQEGITPLMAAAAFADFKNAELLLSAGADASSADSKGRTALHHTMEGVRWWYKKVQSPESFLARLGEAGLDFSRRDCNGQSALDELLHALAVDWISQEFKLSVLRAYLRCAHLVHTALLAQGTSVDSFEQLYTTGRWETEYVPGHPPPHGLSSRHISRAIDLAKEGGEFIF